MAAFSGMNREQRVIAKAQCIRSMVADRHAGNGGEQLLQLTINRSVRSDLRPRLSSNEVRHGILRAIADPDSGSLISDTQRYRSHTGHPRSLPARLYPGVNGNPAFAQVKRACAESALRQNPTISMVAAHTNEPGVGRCRVDVSSPFFVGVFDQAAPSLVGVSHAAVWG